MKRTFFLFGIIAAWAVIMTGLAGCGNSSSGIEGKWIGNWDDSGTVTFTFEQGKVTLTADFDDDTMVGAYIFEKNAGVIHFTDYDDATFTLSGSTLTVNLEGQTINCERDKSYKPARR
jgi:hypothetical protein